MSVTEGRAGSGLAVDEGAQASTLVLLLCTTTRPCPETLSRALEGARELGGGILAVFILDPALLSVTASRLVQAGFDASGRDGDALSEAYAERARDRLQVIAEAAREAGLPVETRLLRGAFGTELEQLVAEERPARLVATHKRRSHYARTIVEGRLLEPMREKVWVDEVEEG